MNTNKYPFQLIVSIQQHSLCTLNKKNDQILYNMLNKINELIQSGIDVNIVNQYGWTALLVAANFGRAHAAPMMRVLIDAGADVNKPAYHGMTALMLAAEIWDEHGVHMMNLLLDAGADVNKKTNDQTFEIYQGCTALMFALMKNLLILNCKQ